ncbi:NAD(P)-dependent oxidoreductase [Pseudorhodoferax sp. Leaf267]|uniref:NAD(P)-dependent oxidoreductase n=1 Tax=Pseudorhodoferax sp. Leaf267 TaxID=1736316 RepID=UPI0006F8FF7E|nr:NAD(P)-dependent oxidoreductase [Pseudorhodoferax sp. Leaf267]KQP18312.1 hydroxyacid dehydrogenase [Pseudorhodoferax sp. Leaf267]
MTTRPTVFLTHSPTAVQNYYGPRALAALEAVATVRRCTTEEAFTAETLAAAAQGCDIIVSDRRAEGSADLLARLPQLVAFCRCAVDIRNVDVAAASAHGILVTQASAGFMASVSEWIVGMMVDLARHLSPAIAQSQAGAAPTVRMGRELRGATLGIVGFGQIGRYLAGLARAFGMRVCVADPFAQLPAEVEAMPLATLLAQSDFVVCLAAATPQTENLMDAAAFAAMQPTAYFINAARGNLVDEAALLRALDAGRIAGCALDVGRAPDQMPSPALARHPLVRATPHIGGLTPPAIEHQSLETAAQVAAIVQGRIPPGAVNAAQALRLQARFPITPGRNP